MKRLKHPLPWGLVLVVAVLAASIPAGCSLWPLALDGETTTAQTGYTQIYKVQRGDISASVTATGEVYAWKREELAFEARDIPLVELNVALGQEVQAGDVLARIETSTLEAALDQAEADFLAAEEALESALNPYTDVDLQRLETAVTQAKADLATAEQKLEEILNPDLVAAQQKVQDAQADLDAAQQALAALQADSTVQENIDYLEWQYNELLVEHGSLLNNPNPSEEQQDYRRLVYNHMMDAKETWERAKIQAQIDLLQAQHDVTAAQEALADAQGDLADLQNGPDPLEVSAAEHAVAQAEHDLKQAKKDLETAQAGPDAAQVRLAQVRYDAAKAAYEEAQIALDEATLVAPFDGTVTRVDAQVGDRVSPTRPVVTLADLTDLRVRATIDETKITEVEVGQAVKITFDAYPTREFEGVVLEVPLEGTLVNNVVTYQVTIRPKDLGDVTLKPGMTANLSILIGEKQDVLLVPAMAVRQSTEGPVVSVQVTADGPATTVPVEIGLSDGTYAEIVRGLNEGDQIVIEYEEEEEELFPAFMQRGMEGPPPEPGMGPSR